MSADLLRRAADAMVAEADRLEALDKAATAAPWLPQPKAWDRHYVGPRSIVGGAGGYDDVVAPGDVQCLSFCYGGSARVELSGDDADLISHRRNTLARDAATLRALAAHLDGVAASLYPGEEPPSDATTIARAFLGETK